MEVTVATDALRPLLLDAAVATDALRPLLLEATMATARGTLVLPSPAPDPPPPPVPPPPAPDPLPGRGGGPPPRSRQTNWQPKRSVRHLSPGDESVLMAQLDAAERASRDPSRSPSVRHASARAAQEATLQIFEDWQECVRGGSPARHMERNEEQIEPSYTLLRAALVLTSMD